MYVNVCINADETFCDTFSFNFHSDFAASGSCFTSVRRVESRVLLLIKSKAAASGNSKNLPSIKSSHLSKEFFWIVKFP
jgi:hypothetical protein